MESINNKNRIIGIICLLIITWMMISPVAYADTEQGMDANAGNQSAGDLKITQTYPENNDNKLQTDNTGIKVYFSANVIDKSVWKNNSNCFSLTDKKGKEVPTEAYSSAKSGTDYILIVVTKGHHLKPASEYYFTVKQGVESKDGKTLDKDTVYHYTTVDTQGNSMINMGLMGLMVVGMIVMNVISTKRKASKDATKKEEKVNPYKVAKEQGKSVEEVIEKMERDKARKAKRLKSKNDDNASADDDEDVTVLSKDKLRRVADGGSTYTTGRKAEAEKKAKQAAANKAKGTTNPKKGKKKGKKK